MTRSSILFAALFALLLFVAGDAQAVDTTKYPATLVDQTCTDAKDTVTGQGPFSTFVQDTTGGGADGLCDHDNRILTGAIASDTTFGPLSGGTGACYIVFLDGNTVTGGDTKWDVIVQVQQPHNGEMEDVDSITTLVTGASDVVYLVGLSTGYAFDSLTESLNVRLSPRWYLKLDLNTATSWTGEISMVRC
jgi:hypothetical protein